MSCEWRWLLVDSLAHGRKWYNPAHSSLVDSPEYTLLREQYDEEGDLRTKLKLAKLLSSHLKGNLNAMYCEFSRFEAAKILSTPRFDINDSFMKADIPGDQGEYFPTLPSLAIPFPEFWVEWRWIDQEDFTRSTYFAARVIAHDPLEDGSIRLAMTSFVWMPKYGSDEDNVCLKYEATAFLSGDRKIEHLDIKGEHKKSEETLMFPCIHAMAILGCRNVTTQEMRAPRQLRRNVERTFGVALCSYRVVNIIHGKRSARALAGKSQGTSRAMSICRGHFKTFDEHGLFGYKKGTWWWQDHIRGEYERGVVIKDYALISRRQTEPKIGEAYPLNRESLVE